MATGTANEGLGDKGPASARSDSAVRVFRITSSHHEITRPSLSAGGGPYLGYTAIREITV